MFLLAQEGGRDFNKNNYRVYFDPADGRMRMHPWDPDWAFYDSTPLGSPYGDLAAACWAEANCKAEFMAVLQAVKTEADTADLEGELSAVLALIPPYVQEDPRKEYSAPSVQANQKALSDWINGRSAQLTGAGY